MIIELREDAFPEIYGRFVKLLGGKPWIKATQDLQLQILENPLTRPQIEQENLEAIGLTFFDQYQMTRRFHPAWPRVQEAMNFAAQVCDMVENALDVRGTRAYIGRVIGAFKNSRDMRAMRIEHLAAIQLSRQGASISWPDESSGPETFDILASGLTPTPIEVECKSNSRDKGRRITQSETMAFLYRILPLVLTQAVQGEALLLRVVVPSRLPTRIEALDQLASEIQSSLTSGDSSTPGGVILEVQRGSPVFLTEMGDPDLKRTALLHYALLEMGAPVGFRGGTCVGSAGVVIEVCSQRRNDLFRKLWDTAKKAIRNQMTGTRPGCLILKLEGWSREEFLRASTSTTNVLGIFAEALFSDEKHEHLACVAFASEEAMVSLNALQGTSQSCLYVADRQVGRYANLGIGQMLLGATERKKFSGQAAALDATTQSPSSHS